jgi:cytoskeletal protein CcmA (bactofilin family)
MLTTTQKATLKAFVEADATLNQIPKTYDGAYALADALKVEASPAFVVWRTSVSAEEIMSNGFVWTAVDALTVGKARIWDWMTRYGTINPSKINVRQGMADAFGAASAMATGIMPHLKRNANILEKLFATGTGTTATPGTMVIEGSLSYQEVHEAMGW